MKSYLLVGILVILIFPSLFAEIRNGYEKEVPRLKFSLQYLKNLLAEGTQLKPAEKRRIKRKIQQIVNKLAYSDITESLLNNFKAIAPDVFSEIDTLRDSKGRIVDVYVKFIPKEEAKVEAFGLVSFEPSPGDETCNSEYGEQSVSVLIWITNNSLLILSHEFGHLQYMVPNLREYLQYYRRQYSTAEVTQTFGHHCDDDGGRNASLFERRYRLSLSRYMKRDSPRVASPYAMLTPAKRRVIEEVNFKGWEFVTTIR